MAKKASKKGGAGKALAVGAGLAVLGGAAYAFLGPNGKKNQKKVKAWSVKMEKEVKKKVKDLKEVTEPVYNKIIEEVSSRYADVKGVSVDEVQEAVEDLKKHWKLMAKDTKKLAKTAKKTVKKVAKKIKG